MMYIILLLIVICLFFFSPYIDIFTDYRGKKHIIIWYSIRGRRKFVNLLGNQE